MGVPALFRWLTKKYPKIITPVIEEFPQEVDGVQLPIDATRPNPNGEEMHNLYLDFNGIVHPCSHPENKPPPADEAEMMLEIFKYTDRVVNMVRPRRLLVIAIDGVAPRAKMNQQRARRFRAAMDAKEVDEKKAEFQTLLRQQQRDRNEDTVEEVVQKTWDSNVITPGTPFMFILAKSVRYWAQWKLNTDPAWAQLKVIISDASVPGEGEHKIMQFIRSQRSDPEYDPNTRHVMYGLDADLIMLGIATHEPHFRVLREDVEMRDAKAKTCNLCGQKGHYADNCRGNAKDSVASKKEETELKPFVWLNVPILREYLGAEMFVPGQSFRFDLERALDDWVFMCFFVGNDFLPHLPSLDIHEDGIDKLIAIWKDNVPVMGGYLTCDGTVDLARAQCILEGLAKQEDAIFRRRREVDQRRERNQKRRQQEDQARQEQQDSRKRRRSSPDYTKGGRSDNRAPAAPMNLVPVSSIDVQIDYNTVVNRGAIDRTLNSNKSAAAAIKAQMQAQKNTALEEVTAASKRKVELMEESEAGTPGQSTLEKKPMNLDDPAPDTVRLWEEGYASRYYEQKFHVKPDDIEFRHQVARAYVEGLAWVLLYYFQGCPSWTWYYPYHYAPFAADFVDLDKMTVKFDKGKPFKPYEQLMGVLPAASNHAIPKTFHPLMTEDDSPIIDFYPEEFELDANGKKQSWKAIVLLPFIDEKRLLEAMDSKYPELTDDERQRNELGEEALILSENNPLYERIVMEYYSKKSKNGQMKLPTRVGQLAGTVSKNPDFLPHMDLQGPQEDIYLEPRITDDCSMSVFYHMPPPTHVHKSMLFPGVKLPPAVLDKSDIAILRSKARTSGRDFGGAPLYDNTRRDPRDNHGRGGRINYAADRPPMNNNPAPHGFGNGSNPFAAFLDPNFVPGQGHPPPPPQAYQNYQNAYNGAGYQGQNGYQGGQQGNQNGYGGHQQGRNQYGQDQRHAQHHGGHQQGAYQGGGGDARGGNGNYRGQGQGQGRGQNGGHYSGGYARR